jgi:hypothetical protein
MLFAGDDTFPFIPGPFQLSKGRAIAASPGRGSATGLSSSEKRVDGRGQHLGNGIVEIIANEWRSGNDMDAEAEDLSTSSQNPLVFNSEGSIKHESQRARFIYLMAFPH